MARFNGMGWRELIKSPEYYAQQTRETLAPIISKLSAVANKRLKRLAENEIQYSNYQGPDAIAGVKKFGAKGKTLAQLRSEYKRLYGFLQSPISTISGRKEQYYQAKKRAWEQERKGEEPNRKQAYEEYKTKSKFADIFDRVALLFMTARSRGWIFKSDFLFNMQSSTQMQSYFQEAVIRADANKEDVYDFIERDLMERQNKIEDLDNQFSASTSEFF